MMITGKQLSLVAHSLKGDRAEAIASALNEICPQYGINSGDILHEFLANLMAECDEFHKFEESLFYRTAERLMNVWPKRFPSISAATPYLRDPQKLAEKVYGMRHDLGNIYPGDGWKFRGSGPIQATGRFMIEQFTKYYNQRFGTNYTAEEMANLLRTDLVIGIHSACWIFAVVKKLIPFAINDLFRPIVKRINGGYTDMDKRKMYLERAIKFIPE